MFTSDKAKEARMRWSSGRDAGQCRPAAPPTEERPVDWSPTRISDRRLIELAHRLEKLHRTDDAFAIIELSQTAQARLNGISPLHRGNP